MVLAYLNCCMCCDCGSFHRLGLGSNLLVICSRQLVVAIIPVYQITSDGHAPRQKKEATCHQAHLLAVTDKCLRQNMYVYILYLRCEDTILAILFTGLPITTTIADKWLNILIFHDDNKFITANGQMIINVDTDNIAMSGGNDCKNLLTVLSHY